MKTFSPGDTQPGLCHKDGRVTITFRHRDVPFRDGHGKVEGILVGVCDCCGDAVLIPAQSTPAIAAAYSSRT